MRDPRTPHPQQHPTKDDRIRRHWLGLKKTLDPKRESLGERVWPTLARVHKMPIREIKRIVGYRGSSPRREDG